MLRSAPCAGEWVAEDPMETSPPASPLLLTKQRLPTSPLLNNTTSNISSKHGNKQTGKQAPGSLVSASDSRTSSKVFINARNPGLNFVLKRF